MKKFSMGFPLQDLEKISHATVWIGVETWDGSRKFGRIGDRRGAAADTRNPWAQKKSSLQGLAGEVLTICKRGCFASEDWRGVNVAEHGFGTSRFAVIVVTGARRAPAPSERLRR